MVLVGNSRKNLAVRGPLMLALLFAGVVALVASGASTAWAQPAQEEYQLNIPDARGGGGGGSTSSGDVRSLLRGGSGSSPMPLSAWSRGTSSGSPGTGSTPGYSPGGGLSGAPTSGGGDSSSVDPLLAKPPAGDSGLLSAGTNAASKTPLGLAVLGALLLITLLGLLAARRRRRARAIELE
jgi:hypothetical protein